MSNKNGKYRIIIIFSLCLFLLVNYASAEDKLIVETKTELEFPSSKFETPIFMPAPNSSFADFEHRVMIQGVEIQPTAIDLDKNGVPEYFLFMANIDLSILNQSVMDFEYSNLPPMVKYKNQTVINKWVVCYQKESDAICGWKDIEADDFKLNLTIFPIALRNRIDLYTIGGFDTSPAVKYFCPLALDLGTWPLEWLYLVNNQTVDSLESWSKKISDYEIYSISNKNKVLKKYDGSLILIGKNISIILTKPTSGLFNSSPDYFFKTQILSSGNIRAAVCTIKHHDVLIPPKGPNAYFVFGEPDDQKLFEMSLVLSNIIDPIVHPTESIQIDFFKGNIWLSGFTSPEIRPSIKLKTTESFYKSLNFSWIEQNGMMNETVEIMNGVFIFDKPILLTGDPWRYPFDEYYAFIYIKPPVLQNTTSSLSFSPEDPYKGEAIFENNKIFFRIERTLDSKIKYFIGLIVSIIIVIFINKNESMKNLDILSLFVTFVAFFSSVNEILSIGSIPYVFMILCLGISYLKKEKSKH